MIQWATLSVEERIATIQRNWEDGVSARDLAARIGGVTRNAIIGMYTRHASKLSDTPLQAPMRPRRGEPKVPRIPKPRKVAVRSVCKRERTAPVPRVRVAPTPPPEPAEVRMVRLIDLEAGDCRWPVGRDGGQHLFCGLERRDRDTSYCGHHAHRSRLRHSEELL